MTKEKIYSEVFSILQMLGNKYIEKVPKGLMEIIESRRDTKYNPKYINSEPLENQGISRETLSMIALIHLNYWCDSDIEKSELKEVLKSNEFETENSTGDLINKVEIKEEEEKDKEKRIREELKKEIDGKLKEKRKNRSLLSKLKRKIKG